MSTRNLIIGLVLMFGSAGCVSELDPVLVPVVDYSTISGTKQLDVTSTKDLVDGVYVVVGGESTVNRFGTILSVKLASNAEVNMYASTGVSYFTLQGGTRNDSGIFVGKWRGVQGPSAGSVAVVILPGEGGTELARGEAADKNLTLRCVIRTGPGGTGQTLVMRRVARLNDDLKEFQIIAHRGGGRNSERLGVSENSTEMMLLAQQLGATAIEIDVRQTKDGVPIVFHDPTYTARTIKGSYIIGDIENYTYEQISRYVRLVNGEKIPTLVEALDAVIRQSEIQFVWLDMKSPWIVDTVMAIQKAALAQAANRDPKLRIMFGIPTTDILDAYRVSPHRGTVEVLCELDAAIAEEIDAAAWAPRFTAGVQRSTAERMRDQGRDVFVWTLDDTAFIEQFLIERYKGKLLYSGILTNYPTLLASRFYTLKVVK